MLIVIFTINETNSNLHLYTRKTAVTCAQYTLWAIIKQYFRATSVNAVHNIILSVNHRC